MINRTTLMEIQRKKRELEFEPKVEARLVH